MRSLLGAALALVWLIAGMIGSGTALTVSVRGPETVLSDQADGVCDSSDLPDAPARAFRRADGKLVLFAPNFRNRAFEGNGIDDLNKDCRVRFAASGNPDPALLDDRTWLHAFHTVDGKEIFALGSASFMPYRHGKRCAAGGERTDCWRNGIAALRSTDGGETFAYLGTPPHHIVFAPPGPYRDDLADPPGFVTATNFVSWQDALYAVLWRRAEPVDDSRNCLARAPQSDTRRWELWDGKAFVPAATFGARGWEVHATDCARIGPRGLPAIRGIVFHRPSATFIGVLQSRRRDAGGAVESGFFYVTSPDLIRWTEPRLLLAVDLRSDAGAEEDWAVYPSLVDDTSPDRDLGTVGADTRLIFVRVIPRAGGKSSRRQLVAVPLAVH